MMHRNLVPLLLVVIIFTTGLAMAAPPKFAYVANHDSNSVSVIDLATDTVVATIPVGPGPGAIAMKPDGTQVWVAGTDGNIIEIDEIDTANNSVASTITLPCPNPTCIEYQPNSLAFTPDGMTAYLVNSFPDPIGATVFVVNVAFNVIGRAIQVGHHPAAVAFTPDSQLAYVTNSEDFSVSVIDVGTSKVLDTIGPANIGDAPFGIAVTPNGKHVYVPYCAPDGIAVIRVKTNSVVATVNAPFMSCPDNIAFPEHGKLGYVTDFSANALSVIDTHTNTVATTISLGPSGVFPFGVAVTGKRAFVTARGSNTVVVVDTANNTVVDTIPVGLSPAGIAVRPLP